MLSPNELAQATTVRTEARLKLQAAVDALNTVMHTPLFEAGEHSEGSVTSKTLRDVMGMLKAGITELAWAQDEMVADTMQAFEETKTLIALATS